MVNYVKKNLNMTAVRIAIVAYESVLASALFGLRELFQAAERFRQPTDAEIDCRYVSAGSELLPAKDDCWQDDERVDVVINSGFFAALADSATSVGCCSGICVCGGLSSGANRFA